MNFRAFVKQLDAQGDLLRVKKSVDPEYELGALVQQAEARRKAIWFDQVQGSAFPAVAAVLSNPQRHAMSVGRDPQEVRTADDMNAVLTEAFGNPLGATTVDDGPAAQVIHTDDADITSLPVPRFFSLDTHKFISAGIGFALDPATGTQNVGFYRGPVIDRKSLSVSAGMTSRLRQIYAAAAERGAAIPVALVIGAPPAMLITAGARVPPELSDVEIAGALQGAPIELMRCQTSELLVPAAAEIIIEAVVDFSADISHTMGEFPDQYGSTDSPVARVTAITHREDAVFHTILGGMNREHNSLGAYIFSSLGEELLDELRPRFPCIRDLHVELVPRRSGGRGRLAIAIQKTADSEPQDLIDATFALSSGKFPMESVLQRIVIVDEDVDIRSANVLEWAISMRANRADRVRVYENKSHRGATTVRLGIDATKAVGDDPREARPEIPGADSFLLDDYL
jgi:2,5-furandicarboxylate decarboxylase 1